MFIRVKIKSLKGKKYKQHQLIESVRTPAGPRQRLLLNLGQHLDLEENQFKMLANRIEAIVTKQENLFPVSDQIEALAIHFAEQIIQKNLQLAESSAQKNEKNDSADYASVDLNSMTHSQARSLGAEYVALEILNQIKMPKILSSLSFNDAQIKYALMLIITRMVHPSSERACAEFINNRSALCELLATGISVYDNALHRAAVKLLENKDAIEVALAQNSTALFEDDETIFLYDLTNTYFEGSKVKSHMAGFNRSKDRRHDRPLITLALVVDQMGLPRQSRILKGACSESATIKDLLGQLNDSKFNWQTKEKTIVIDAGLASEDNLKLINAQGFHYVAVSRRQTYPDNFWDASPEEEISLNDKKNTLRVRLNKTASESFLLCKSSQKLIKERNILSRRQQKFEEALNTLNNNFAKKGKLKNYEKVLEKIGRLKEQHKVGHFYSIKVEHQDNICSQIIFERNQKAIEQKPPGEYVLRTDRTDFSTEQISRIHRSLTTIEDSFRSMKSHLGLRPNFHHTDEPMAAHIFITVLAYNVLAVLLNKLRTKGINHNWSTIRCMLQTHTRLTTTLRTQDNKTINIRSNTRPDMQQTIFYKALKINHDPIGRIKTVINKCSAENIRPKNLNT